MPLYATQQLGQAGQSFSSFNHSGLNTDNQVGNATLQQTCGVVGRARRFFVFMAGDGATVTARLGCWKVGGANPTVSFSNQFTAPSGSESTGGQVLNEQWSDGIHDAILDTTALLFFAFWRLASGSAVWSVQGSGDFQFKTVGGDITDWSAATDCPGSGFTCGYLQAYGYIYGGSMKAIEYGAPLAARARKMAAA